MGNKVHVKICFLFQESRLESYEQSINCVRKIFVRMDPFKKVSNIYTKGSLEILEHERVSQYEDQLGNCKGSPERALV